MNAAEKSQFDFHYAVANTDIVLAPKKSIETFGNTIINYTLVAEMMDDADKVRVRDGRMVATRPQIVTPSAYSKLVLDGFGEEAERYASWLREHEDSIRILQYGYSLRQEAFSEEVVSESIDVVLERVKAAASEKDDPFRAVVKGVDSLWDVCLVKLFWEVTRASVRDNFRELNAHRMFEMEAGIPYGVREEIEKAFAAASRDPSLVRDLGSLLKRHGVFEHYQDRFFALVRH